MIAPSNVETGCGGDMPKNMFFGNIGGAGSDLVTQANCSDIILNYVGAVGLGDLVGAAPSNVAEEHVFGMSPPQPVSTLEGAITDNHHFELMLRGNGSS